jgi:hypothetical protein
MVHFICFATNKFRALAERLRDRLAKHYQGTYQLHVFTEAPMPGVIWHGRHHQSWLEAVRDRFVGMATLEGIGEADHVFLIDADTDLERDVTADMLLGETVVLEHFLNKEMRAKNSFGYAQPPSEAYIPADTPLPKAYYHCCFGGGRWGLMRHVYAELAASYRRDIDRGIEPIWNDESHWNHYFHYHPPARVLSWPSECPFKVSDKAGIKDIRRA